MTDAKTRQGRSHNIFLEFFYFDINQLQGFLRK